MWPREKMLSTRMSNVRYALEKTRIGYADAWAYLDIGVSIIILRHTSVKGPQEARGLLLHVVHPAPP